MKFSPVEKIDTTKRLPQGQIVPVGTIKSILLQPKFEGSFVRFYHGSISDFESGNPPVSQQHALKKLEVKDVGFQGNSTGEGLIANRTLTEILRSAPTDVVAFQVMNSSNLRSMFVLKTRVEKSESDLFWIGRHLTSHGENAVQTGMGDLIKVEKDDSIYSHKGDKLWPEQKVASPPVYLAKPVDDNALSGTGWQYGRHIV